MKSNHQLLDEFIAASSSTNHVVVADGDGLQISPHVQVAIKTAKTLLSRNEDHTIKNRVAGLLHDIYIALRDDIKLRGVQVNGKIHPALNPSLQVYRIIIS